jgi:S1-C subfamily serine protease
MRVPSLSWQARRLLPLAVGACLAGGGLAAQDPEPRPEVDRDDCVCIGGMDFTAAPMAFRYSTSRARIGVTLGDPAEVGGRRGVEVEDIADDGPAARAGILPGDVLLSVNGSPLGSAPSRRLIELMADVEPGDTVAVGYSRAGQDRTASVVAGSAPRMALFGPEGARVWSTPGETLERVQGRLREVGPSFHRLLRSDALELVDMNAGLGDYFGTTEGVLVARVEDDSPLGLRAGDVILSVGGRTVQDPAHARSIIHSYTPDEAITFDVMRQKRRTTVTGKRGP